MRVTGSEDTKPTLPAENLFNMLNTIPDAHKGEFFVEAIDRADEKTTSFAQVETILRELHEKSLLTAEQSSEIIRLLNSHLEVVLGECRAGGLNSLTGPAPLAKPFAKQQAAEITSALIEAMTLEDQRPSNEPQDPFRRLTFPQDI